MALNLRRKQTECLIRMLNLNQAVSNAGGTANEEVYKILIYDRFCLDILSPLIHVKDLRKHGVTLYFLLDKDRNPVHDVPTVYFLQPTPHNIQRVVADASRGLYDAFHLNFSSSIPRPLLENLATDMTSENVQPDSALAIPRVVFRVIALPVPASHGEKPEKFTGVDFKRWQQKMLFYLTTLNLARFLPEDALKLQEGE